MKADPLLASFDFAHVHRVQVGLFGQLFLTQPGLTAVAANGIAEDFEMLRFARHDASRKQERGKSDTPNMGVFFLRSIERLSKKQTYNK